MIQTFILGIAFAIIGAPILSAISDMLVAWIGVLTTKACVFSAKISKNITKYETESEEEI